MFTKKIDSKVRKPVCRATGVLASVLRPGVPALYLYNGQIIRTTAVESILEASPDYVRFETQDIIYKISFLTGTSNAELVA